MEKEARWVAKINKRKSLWKKARSSSSKSAFINSTEREKEMRNGRKGREVRQVKTKERKRRRGLILSYNNLSKN